MLEVLHKDVHLLRIQARNTKESVAFLSTKQALLGISKPSTLERQANWLCSTLSFAEEKKPIKRLHKSCTCAVVRRKQAN